MVINAGLADHLKGQLTDLGSAPLSGSPAEKADLRSELVRLAARLIVEEGLEGEAADALGREYYVRGAAPGAGYRNGYRTGRLKTAEGMVEYAVPQICDRAAPFRSRLREIIRGRSEELEALAVEMYARGLSARDIEALFADERGQSLGGIRGFADARGSVAGVQGARHCLLPGRLAGARPHVAGRHRGDLRRSRAVGAGVLAG